MLDIWYNHASLLLLMVSCYCHTIPFLNHFPSHRRAVIRRTLGPSYNTYASPYVNKNRVFYPTDYGADPLGKNDSSEALDQTIQAVISSVSSQKETLKDLGGVVIDFAGGEYAVSKPVRFPAGYSNFLIMDGTLRALPNFPAGGTLLQIGNVNTAKGESNQHTNEDISIQRLTLNGSNIVGTALAVENGQNVNIGPAIMVFGFERFGITMNGTGAGFIHDSWLGQFYPGIKGNCTATAIYLDNSQHDCYVDNVIIWSGLIGIWSRNGANQFQGVHTWNLMTTKGGIGIILVSGKGRVVNCYLDFNPLVIVNPNGAVVTNTLFLAKGNLVLQNEGGDGVRGLTVSNNLWNSEGKYVNDTIVLNGKFNFVHDSFIEGNVIDKKWNAKSTRATRTANITKGNTKITIDFSNDLLFDTPIKEAYCSVQASEYVGHVLHPLVSKSVTVELSKSVSEGKVLCSVDQSMRTHAAH